MIMKLFSRPSLCVNCRICEMACSLEKSGMFSPSKARIWISRNKKGQDTPMICRHCLAAPCEKACPVEDNKPIWRDKQTGVVKFSLENCIGCYECVKACPFGAMRLDSTSGEVGKCDLCDSDPECVKWCPTGAISCVDIKTIGVLCASEKI